MNEYLMINIKYHAKKTHARHYKTGKGILSPKKILVFTKFRLIWLIKFQQLSINNYGTKQKKEPRL